MVRIAFDNRHNPVYNALVSFLVDQTFNLNYEMALSSGRKTFNRIHFLLTDNVKNFSEDLQNLNRGNLSNQRIGQNIFEPNELMNFKDGEILVLRATIRRDKYHHRFTTL